MIGGFLLLAAVVLFIARRRRRALLAGLNSDRPTFSIAPPTRFSTRLRDHRL